MSAYQVLKSMYQLALPKRVRTFLWMNPVTRTPREWLLRRIERLATHDEMYSRDYFESVVDPAGARSAPVMAATMVRELKPGSMIDVGCGTGQMIMAFARLGVRARGLEYSDAALDICRERALEVCKFNLELEQSVGWRADVAVSTEVAEHLPESCADRYVDLLCRLATTVMITAAVPGSTGTDHVNEQPNEYWIGKFDSRGFDFDRGTSLGWRDEWREAGIESWYWSTAMLFRRRML